MKFNFLKLLSMPYIFTTLVCATPTPQFPRAQAPTKKQGRVALKQPLKQIATTPQKTFAKTAPATQPSSTTTPQVLQAIPYMAQLEKAGLPPAEQQAALQTWQALYNLCLASSNGTLNLSTPATQAAQNAKISPSQATLAQQADVTTILKTNFLAKLKNYLNQSSPVASSGSVPLQFANDPQNLQRNYATVHLQNAVARLDSVFKFQSSPSGPTVQFTGDNRDLGIIVNIQNNTDSTFSIAQNSLDGKTSTPIGTINPGLNGVNLHTAALQAPEAAHNAVSTSSFVMTSTSGEAPSTITIQMMSGTQLVEFLTTLPRKDKDIFSMNGLPTSPEYLATPTDFYCVLIHNPAKQGQTTAPVDQRIQAINISKLTGSYLLTMQINQETIELPQDKPASKAQDADVAKQTPIKHAAVVQPSITQVNIIKNQKIKDLQALPLILPQFLWEMPIMQAYWILLMTSYLAASSDFAIFGITNFGDSFEYFKNLSCFDNGNRHDFFIDLYNRFEPGYIVLNASWLMSVALYETNLKTCSDISQIYTAQDEYGRVVVNKNKFYYVNFIVMCTPSAPQGIAKQEFYQKGFNKSYHSPWLQLYSFVVNALTEDMKNGIFADLTKLKNNIYHLRWTNKKNEIITSQSLYLNDTFANIEITFTNLTENWIGSSVPKDLIPLSTGETTHFKVTYEYSASNQKHILLTQFTSPIDKQEVFLPLYLGAYPPQELYISASAIFNVKPYTKYTIINDSLLPEPLTMLTKEDWQNGVYMVPIFRGNNKEFSTEEPESASFIFYKSDKSYLGKFTTTGNISNGSRDGALRPIDTYNAHLSKSNCLMNLYLSTGVFLQLNQNL